MGWKIALRGFFCVLNCAMMLVYNFVDYTNGGRWFFAVPYGARYEWTPGMVEDNPVHGHDLGARPYSVG